ncbi:hypothetical protein E4665_10690 [Sporolactobacillus shoreae]|uniref:Uncharacterized protein n=1 Tax=Sporolactobacillus shoreae TaxID=1465501 RepID=A0A4Z0GNL6_9BACL|nr:hypothetical protein [Sporolactobacillus shoreae]TGA97857.1 hypothetical protein E4665_10690 [Sporolactobacillus shoreae]
MQASFIEWLTTVLPVGVILFFANDWLTGDGLIFSGRDADERKRAIKYKSIVGSWTAVLALLIVDFLQDFFRLRSPLHYPPIKYPELFYLILAVVCYFIFYIINSRKMRA